VSAATKQPLLVGVDVGGTFTDVFCSDGTRTAVVKVPSQPDAPGAAVMTGIDRALAQFGRPMGDVGRLIHGTTVATNAIVQRRGGVLALITTEGFHDVLEIGRLKRWSLYDWNIDAETPTFLADRDRRIGIPERIDSSGSVLKPLDEQALRRGLESLMARFPIEAVAVSFLFSFANGSHERRAREIIREIAPAVAVSISSEVDPEYREYERTAVTAFDAYLRPVVSRYMTTLVADLEARGFGTRVQVMQSRGGIASADVAVEAPITMVMSGPAGGVAAARYVAGTSGYPNLVTFDMGGTSSDVALIIDGHAPTTSEGRIDRYPVRVPIVDVNSIGAGGGSIVWVDSGGRLRVGPHSAGADPGPVCYGRGGTQPTVTDASLLLGYLNPNAFAMGELALDRDAAEAALQAIGAPLGMGAKDVALGVHRIINASMADQIRLVTVKRGRDPRMFSLLAFGGAGPVHAPALARDLDIPRVIVPPAAGVLSALGLLTAEIEHEKKTTIIGRATALDPARLESVYQQLESDCLELMRRERVAPEECILRRLADFRYLGQSSELQVTTSAPTSSESIATAVGDFTDRHQRTYGYSNSADRVELVNARVLATFALPAPDFRFPEADSESSGKPYATRVALYPEGEFQVGIYRRSDLPAGTDLAGPLIVEQPDTTVVVGPGQTLRLDGANNVIVSV
jgi:N-methylhydantoinase A